MLKSSFLLLLLSRWTQSSHSFTCRKESHRPWLLPTKTHRTVTPSHVHHLYEHHASKTTTPYDIVRVDLEDGRDYPIYIGSNFDPTEGMK